MLVCGFANLQMSPRSEDHLLKVRMHDRFAERDQLQRLDELLARDVLTEEATSTCLKRGKDVIRGVRLGEDNNTQTWICRIYPPYQVVCGPPAFVHPDEPNTDRSRHHYLQQMATPRAKSTRREKERPSRKNLVRVDDRDRGNGNDKPGAPFDDMAHLLHDLLLEVPRKDQDVVGLGVVDRLDRVDGDVHAGRVAPMLVRVAIDGEVQEIGADGGVVEQSVTFARGAIATDALPFLLGFDENGKKLALGALDPAGKINIGGEVLETC